MTEFVGMTPRTARKVAEVIHDHDGAVVSQPVSAQTQHRSQLVSGMRGGTGVVVVRAIPEDTGDYGTVLLVQRIMLTDAGQWAATGEPFEMPTFPLMPAVYWQHFVVPEGSVPEFSGHIQPTRTIGGVECVELFVPLFPVTIRSDDPYRGPRPV